MNLTLVCSKCQKSEKGSASSGAVLAKKRGWSIKSGLMFCPECAGPAKKKKRINATHVTIEGHAFDSEMESRYYLRLKKRLQQGEISLIAVHPSFLLQEAFVDSTGRIWAEVRVTFDFQYIDFQTGMTCVDDCKPVNRKTGKAISNDRAKAFLPLVQLKYPQLVFRFVDEFGVALPLSGTRRKMPKGTGQKKLL